MSRQFHLRMVQLDLNLILANEVHACILGPVPSIFEKLACLYTAAREIAVHNTLRATCKSYHTSNMQVTPHDHAVNLR